MNGSTSRWVWPGATTGALVLVVAACNDDPTLPPLAPDCNGGKDAGCAVAIVGGGSSTAPAGQNEDAASQVTVFDGATSCGAAVMMLTTATAPSCVPCVVSGTSSTTGTDCCAADLACSTSIACLSIVACANLCQAGNAACVSSCVELNPVAADAFDQFAQCLVQNCSPECPKIMPAVGDQ